VGNRSTDAVFKELFGLEKKLQNKIIRKGQRAGCKVLASQIKASAPVDSGRTKRSVKVRAGRRKKGVISTNVEVTGDHDAPFIGFVEFGTKEQLANPFIRRSVESKRAQVVEAIAAEVEAGIKNSRGG
jgi:HK97 gp10 family phage protein